MTTTRLDPTSADALRIEALRARIERLADESDRLSREAHLLTGQMCDLIEQAKPTYPTDGHRYGIVEAARRIRAGERAKNVHGHPCGPDDDPYCVKVAPSDSRSIGGPGSWLNVKSDGNNYHRTLWRFGASDVEALIGLLLDEGFEVVKHWACDGGHSFVVLPVDQAAHS